MWRHLPTATERYTAAAIVVSTQASFQPILRLIFQFLLTHPTLLAFQKLHLINTHFSREKFRASCTLKAKLLRISLSASNRRCIGNLLRFWNICSSSEFNLILSIGIGLRDAAIVLLHDDITVLMS